MNRERMSTYYFVVAALTGSLILSACGARSAPTAQPARPMNSQDADRESGDVGDGAEGDTDVFPVNQETPQPLDLYADEPEYLPPGEWQPVDPLPQPTFEVVEPGTLGEPAAADPAPITDSGFIDMTASPQNTWHGLVSVGDDEHDHQLVGFIEFDLSPFAGRHVTGAEFDTGYCTTAGAPIQLMPFTLVNANTNQVLASFMSCSYQVDATSAVSAALSGGRLRLHLALGAVAADGLADEVEFPAPSLTVVYTP